MGNKNRGDKQLPQRSGRRQQKHVKESAAPPEAINPQRFAWSASEVDHEYVGEWSWDLTRKDVADLLKLLEELSRLTWGEVKAMTTGGRDAHKKHHDQPVSSICAAAQRRLEQLQVGVDRVFRLRHGSSIRIWGYLVGPVFHILWYDRDHQVCPGER